MSIKTTHQSLYVTFKPHYALNNETPQNLSSTEDSTAFTKVCLASSSISRLKSWTFEQGVENIYKQSLLFSKFHNQNIRTLVHIQTHDMSIKTTHQSLCVAFKLHYTLNNETAQNLSSTEDSTSCSKVCLASSTVSVVSKAGLFNRVWKTFILKWSWLFSKFDNQNIRLLVHIQACLYNTVTKYYCVNPTWLQKY